MRKFINGPLAGTNLEIMPSPAATTLADGTPIVAFNAASTMNATQALAITGDVDVHARQSFVIDMFLDQDADGDEFYQEVFAVGPSIAQQWKNEYKAMLTQRGWTARYYRESEV